MLRKPGLALAVVLVGETFAQGFNTSSINWGLPAGGYVDDGVTHGYFVSALTSANSGDNGCENWTLQDMTADGRPELVVTGALNGTNVQEFSPSNNSYWKVYQNNGSGYDTSPLNWSLPTGGYLDNGVTHGYFVSELTSANSGDNGCENWTLQDMTGDAGPELVITGALNGTNVQEFSPSSNSYWKVYVGPSFAGVAETASPASFSIAPNPCAGAFSIRSDQRMDDVEVIDMTGRTLYRSTPFSTSAAVDLPDLVDGCYLVRVGSGKTLNTRRLIITRIN